MNADHAEHRLKGYAMVALAAAGWGFWPLVLRKAEAKAPIAAALEGLFPLVVMTLVAMPFALSKLKQVPRTVAPWLVMAWLGVSDAGNVLCFFSAYQRTSVAIAVLTHYLTPLLVALAAPIFLGEGLERRTLIAAAVSLFGLTLLLEPWRATLVAGDLTGAALGALSALFYASNVIANKRLGAQFSPAQILFFHGLVAAPLLYLRVPAGALQLAPTAFAWLSLGSLLLGAASGVLFLLGLRHIRASEASLLTLIEPLVAVTLGALVLSQPLHLATIAGGALVLGSAAWMMRSGASRASVIDSRQLERP
jgi:drug/metabolite transporter (DMT)-like permease